MPITTPMPRMAMRLRPTGMMMPLSMRLLQEIC
jgi:hypothetical protein